MDSERFYLDYNATSPLSTSVKEWLKSGEVIFANPASQHSFGKIARKSINEDRSKIFKIFGKDEKTTSLFFHSGATEAFYSLLFSFSEISRKEKKKLLVCYSKIDHPAVTSLSEKYWGEHVRFYSLKINTDLTYAHEENLDYLKEQKSHDSSLIILYHHLWAHNETGFISPLIDLNPFKSIKDLYLHIDAVQAPGKVLNWRELNFGDIWSFSAHKFGALKGIGFSFIDKKVPFVSFLTGGGQQSGLRGGTENPMGVKSISLALSDLDQVNVSSTMSKCIELEAFIENQLEGIGGVLKGVNKNSNTIYFYLNDFTSDISLALFDLHGLMISAGSACSSGAAKPAQILISMGLEKVSRNGLRLSLAFDIDEENLNKIKGLLIRVFSRLHAPLASS